MFMEEQGSITQQWETVFGLPTTLADFRTESADLTGSGREDIVVATMNGVSNGMGVEYWEVRAIVEGKLSNPVNVEDYGVMGYLTKAKSDKRCMLLVTSWNNGWEPKRGYGLYLSGQWFAYSNSTGEFYRVLDRPAVHRRYLYGFERLRLSELAKEDRVPLLWFHDKDAKTGQQVVPPDRR
jgi:hypothetical protein